MADRRPRHGAGIAASDRERIFEAFEQAGPAGTVSAGTGLGLAISRRLARLLGGDVDVDSALGSGSTFVLTLPIEPQIADRAGCHRPPACSRARASRTREPNRETEAERGIGTRAFERGETCGDRSIAQGERQRGALTSRLIGRGRSGSRSGETTGDRQVRLLHRPRDRADRRTVRSDSAPNRPTSTRLLAATSPLSYPTRRSRCSIRRATTSSHTSA